MCAEATVYAYDSSADSRGCEGVCEVSGVGGIEGVVYGVLGSCVGVDGKVASGGYVDVSDGDVAGAV